MTKPNLVIPNKIFPLYSRPVWSFISVLIVVILMFVTQYIQNQLYANFVFTVSIIATISLLTPLIGYYLYKTFVSLQDTISSLTETNQTDWFSKQTVFIFGVNRWSTIFIVLLAIGGLFINFIFVWKAWTGFAKFMYFLHASIFFGALGIIGWAYFGILLFSSQLKNLTIDPEPFETKKDEFDKLNSSLLGMFFIGATLYIGTIIASWISPISSYLLQQFILQTMVFPLAIGVFGFFILVQYFLHEIMKKSKRIRLNKISLLIRKHYREWEHNPSENYRATINDLFLWKEKIEKEKDFPFDFVTVASVTVTVLLPAVKTIIELLYSR